jgi:hypothetical protein
MAELAGRVAPPIDERKDAGEQTDCGDEKKQDAVAQGLAAGSGGCGGGLVAHRAALGGGARCRDAKRHYAPSCGCHPQGTSILKISKQFLGFPPADYLSISKNRIRRTHRPLIACQYTDTASTAVALDKRRSGRNTTAASATTPPSTCNPCAAVNT